MLRPCPWRKRVDVFFHWIQLVRILSFNSYFLEQSSLQSNGKRRERYSRCYLLYTTSGIVSESPIHTLGFSSIELYQSVINTYWRDLSTVSVKGVYFSIIRLLKSLENFIGFQGSMRRINSHDRLSATICRAQHLVENTPKIALVAFERPAKLQIFSNRKEGFEDAMM